MITLNKEDGILQQIYAMTELSLLIAVSAIVSRFAFMEDANVFLKVLSCIASIVTLVYSFVRIQKMRVDRDKAKLEKRILEIEVEQKERELRILKQLED